MNNNARYDRFTNFLELEVNVPRTIGILRDVVECSSNAVHSISKRNHKTNVTISIDVTTHHTWYSSTTLERKKSLSLVTTTFPRLRKFITEHYEERVNYREFLKFSCREKVGANCSLCKEWTGPVIDRCPKPFPDHSCLPQYHYLPYNNTPREGLTRRLAAQSSVEEGAWQWQASFVRFRKCSNIFWQVYW